MDEKKLKEAYEKALEELKEKKSYRLNFGVYYTPKF